MCRNFRMQRVKGLIDMRIKSLLNKYLFRKKWKKLNPNNNTFPVGLFNPEIVTVGKWSYGPIDVRSDVKGRKLVIGSFCSIGDQVTFLLGRDHPTDHISTFPFRNKIAGEYEAVSKGDIIVEDDVWIGFRSTILSGVTIGRGAIIAAGAVVANNVPPYAIVGGVPARVIKYRFDEKTIQELETIDYDTWNDDFIVSHLDVLYKPAEEAVQLISLK